MRDIIFTGIAISCSTYLFIYLLFSLLLGLDMNINLWSENIFRVYLLSSLLISVLWSVIYAIQDTYSPPKNEIKAWEKLLENLYSVANANKSNVPEVAFEDWVYKMPRNADTTTIKTNKT